MSDEFADAPGFWQDGFDGEASAQRDPRVQDARRLTPGTALSVLWWEDDERGSGARSGSASGSSLSGLSR